jgi:hypothetical protein
MVMHIAGVLCEGISLAWRFIFSRASLFICNFIC